MSGTPAGVPEKPSELSPERRMGITVRNKAKGLAGRGKSPGYYSGFEGA